jgi:hypothetical protein
MTDAPARPARAIRVHPAVGIVERTERLWEADRRTAGDRAMLIVQRLIETGHLQGSMRGELALAPEEAAAPTASDHTHAND